jgi:hypothetical protein
MASSSSSSSSAAPVVPSPSSRPAKRHEKKGSLWETREEEWRARYLDARADGVSPFVPCAVLGMCRSDQRCRTGSDGWMCVSCREGYKRGLDGKCDLCNTAEVAGSSVALAVVVFMVVLGLWLYSRKRAKDAALAKLASSSGGGSPAPPQAAEDGKDKSGKDKKKMTKKKSNKDGSAPKPPDDTKPSFVTLLKVGTTFAQTLSALASYADPARLEVADDNAQIVPPRPLPVEGL